MTKLLVLLFACAIGCTSNPGNDPGDDPPGDVPPGDDPPGDDPPGDDPPGGPVQTCLGTNNCVCPGSSFCGHNCGEGVAECHVQGQTGAVEVVCDDNAECHVECSIASSCKVDCGGSAQCHVTCPDGNCEVTNCIGDDCVVSCGNDGDATLDGTTATCP